MADTRESVRAFKARMAAVNARTVPRLDARVTPREAWRWASNALRRARASGWTPGQDDGDRDRAVLKVRETFVRLHKAAAARVRE